MKIYNYKIFAGILILLASFTLHGQDYLVGTGQKSFTRLQNGKLPHDIATYGYANYLSPIDTTITDESQGVINGVHSDVKHG